MAQSQSPRRIGATRTEQDMNRKTVMISSTARDLPTHREKALDACLRQGMFPVMMEHLPASDDEAISASLKMVDEANIYLGIFAHRYGYIPKGHNISITEMEYNRAVKRGIPRCIFIMHEDHPIKASDVEKGAGASKLDDFKARLQTDNIVNFFRSPDELHSHIINSLSQYRVPDLTAFHYVSDIPAPPEPYIAHPYVLMQTTNLIGRQAELNLLTDWVTRPQRDIYWARILNIVAIGGMGKSALTWKWFNDIASQKMRSLAGRLWWSFYESDASFENFVIRALAYVSRRPREEIQQLNPLERENQLLAMLDREPYLFVLDGLERILIAYARMDAARLADDDLDQQTANRVAGALGLPESAAQSFTGQHQLRKTADPRASNFLRKLAHVRSSRILVSTRLYPADLQTSTGGEAPGSRAIFLQGLSDDDALNLWRAFGVSGSREALLRLFHRFDNHPLLIQALAGEVANDRQASGNFDRWQKAHHGFNPFSLPIVQVKSHILAFALQGLDANARQTLHTIAAFRMPATYDTLVSVLVGKRKPYRNENALIATLTSLEDRGLLGWDRRANRYDLHPLVRGVTWDSVDSRIRQDIYEILNAHFEPLSKIDEDQVSSLDDLASAIELYNTLIGLGRYDDAFELFRDRLHDAMFYLLGTIHQFGELLAMLFPHGLNQLPRLNTARRQSFVLNVLANGLSDQPGRAAMLYRRCIAIDEKQTDKLDLSTDFFNLSDALRFCGNLYDSEIAARRSLLLERKLNYNFQEYASLYSLGVTLAARGEQLYSARALDRSLALTPQSPQDSVYKCYDYQAMRALWFGQFAKAQEWANKAMAYNQQQRFEKEITLSARLQGEAALSLDDLPIADERLHHALTRARAINLTEEELPTLIGLAELRRRQGELKEARELLGDVWEAAERGPFRLFHADARNVLAEVERDAGNPEQAVEAATEAYRLAWCDGPPFAYHRGLQKARALLAELGAPEPVLPPFDPTKFEPMPEVEIEPAEEKTEEA